MNDQPQNPSNQETPCGLISCFLAVVAWLVVIVTWVWVLTRPRGTFNDQGGLMLTFIVMPLTFGAWCVGGPIALALGGRALKHVNQSEDASGERRIARTGVFLSRLLFWAGVVWLLFILLVGLLS